MCSQFEGGNFTENANLRSKMLKSFTRRPKLKRCLFFFNSFTCHHIGHGLLRHKVFPLQVSLQFPLSRIWPILTTLVRALGKICNCCWVLWAMNRFQKCRVRAFFAFNVNPRPGALHSKISLLTRALASRPKKPYL